MSEHNNLLKRFNSVTKMAERLNGRFRMKRFFIMTHTRNHKTTDIGIYDSKTKKWELTDIRAFDAFERVSTMEKILKKADKAGR